MRRKRKDPNDPEVIAAIVQSIHEMTRDDLIELIKWRPEGYQDPEGEEDPWKEFLEQEEAAKAARAASKQPFTDELRTADDKAA